MTISPAGRAKRLLTVAGMLARLDAVSVFGTEHDFPEFRQVCQDEGISGSYRERTDEIARRAQQVVRFAGDSEAAAIFTTRADVPPTVLGTPWLNIEDTAGMTTKTVTNTNDAGDGSLRKAVADAEQAGGNCRIVFNLPRTDQAFDGMTGTWRIRLASILIIRGSRIFIDGFSQTQFGGETNPRGPEVIIDGSGFFTDFATIDGQTVFAFVAVLVYEGDQNWIRGLCFQTNRQQNGIMGAIGFSADRKLEPASGNRLDNCYIGLNPDGENIPQSFGIAHGITLDASSQDSFIDNNAICVNANSFLVDGPFLRDASVGFGPPTTRNIIRNNKIGTDATGTKRLAPQSIRTGSGIANMSISGFFERMTGNTFENNIIAGTRSGGIGFLGRFDTQAPRANIIRNNRIGIGPNGENIAPPVGRNALLSPDFQVESDQGAYAVGIEATAGDVVTGNMVANFALSGILVRNTTGNPSLPAPTVEGNTVTGSLVGIQAGQTTGATIRNNTLNDCSKGGVVLSESVINAANVYAFPRPPANPTGLPSVNMTVSRTAFTTVTGPHVALADSVLELVKGNYSPNLRTTPDQTGPNLFQPSPTVTSAERRADNTIAVTGNHFGSGTVEIYAVTGDNRRFLASVESPGTFASTIPAADAAGVSTVAATVTVGGQTSEFSQTVAVTNTPPTDTEKPVVNVSAPVSGQVVESRAGASVAVAWTSSDNVGVASQSVRFTGRRGGQPFAETVAASLPGTASSFTLTVRPDDAVTDAQVVVEARDAAANVGEGRSGVFTITAPVPADTQKPTVSNVVLNKKKVVRKTDSTLLISWQSADNVGVVAHDVSFAPDGTTFSVVVAAGLPGDMKAFTWTVPDKSVLPKTKTGIVRVTARDAAGNIGTATSTAVVIK